MKFVFTIFLLFSSLITAQPDWTLMPSGTTKDINAIWGSSPYNVYAVGEDGLILHYDGFVWENITTSITADLVDIIGFSASEIYILSSDTLYERVGNTWGVFAARPSFSYANTIWGNSGTSLFVGGGLPSGGSSGIYYYNGSQWTTMVSGFSTVNDIYGSQAGDIYAGGNNEGTGGKIQHFKNCTGSNSWWSTAFPAGLVTGVWATGTDNAFASIRDGRIYGYTGQLLNGICWQEIWNVLLDLGSVVKFHGIWGFSDRIYAFGSKNRLPIGTTTSSIYKFYGQSWTEMTTQTDSTDFRTVYSVWGTDTSNVFAVGENGLILKLHGEVYDTLVVNKTSDEPDLNPGDGLCNVGGPLINGKPPCTLNAAIMESNATHSDDNIIIFDIEGGLPHFIPVDSPLPSITDKVIIKAPRKIVNGTSEPGVFLQGISLSDFNGLSISSGADGTELYNLDINSFREHGININGSSEIIIKGCWIKNEKNGIHIFNSSGNQIGGEGIDNRNIISGNGQNGISISGGRDNIIINNFIGTSSDGIIEIPNTARGIFMENSSGNEIGGDFNKTGNIVSGNVLSNIYLISSFNNKIKGNIIGLNIFGDSLHNGGNGISLFNSSNNEIGGFNSDSYMEKNIISRHIIGISIYKGSKNIVSGNFIGTDLEGLSARGNSYGIKISFSDRNLIGSNGSGYFGEFNLISGNYGGIVIEGDDRSTLNDINNNIIGSNFNKDSLGNDIGIILFGGIDTRIGEPSEELDDSLIVNQYKNWIYYNKDGIQIFNLTYYNDTEILKNHFYRNQRGIVISGTKNLDIINNWFERNGRAITGSNSELYINNNFFDNSQEPNSSIHLNNSYANIKNNLIILDAGDAIKLENSSTADINFNNIFDNSGFGVNNTTPSIITNAQSNWWGDASGPSGQGSGSGDPVSTGVNFSNWLTQLLAVTVTASSDTVFSPIGNSDSAFVYLGNWLNPDDVLDVTLSENLNWLQGALNYSVNLDSVFGVSSKILFQVPGSVTPGTINSVQVTAVSQSNPTHSQTDTFYVEAYQPVVNAIYVLPDSVFLAVGDSIQFSASGYDQHNKIVDFIPQWNSNGGVINNNGWFYAGNQTGSFEVTATDPASQVQGIATVIISPTTNIDEKFSFIPTEYFLYQNYPNPFNPSTSVRFAIPVDSKVSLTIYNILGEQIEKLINDEIKNPGIHEATWNASRFASGVYIYLIKAESLNGGRIYRNAVKMILLK
jgi:hypothetical protein